MGDKYKQCPRGHYYKGNSCPYCPTQYYPNSGSERLTRTAGTSQHNPTFYPTETPTSTATDTVIPLCPHCGRMVRRFIPKPPKEVRISSINNMGDGIVPWNYEWDGRCENCGHDFNIVMRIDMGSTGPDNKVRETRIRVGAKGFLHHITSSWNFNKCTVLSGVEIESRCGLGNEREKFFLSANELKYLIRALQESPILKQLDYYSEYDESELVDERTTL